MNFEDYIKNSLDGFESGNANEAWNSISGEVAKNNMKYQLSAEYLKNYDAGFEQNAWSSISKQVQLNNQRYKTLKVLKGAAAVALVAGLSIAGFLTFNNSTDLPDNALVQNTASEPSAKQSEPQQNPEFNEANLLIQPSSNEELETVIENKSINTGTGNPVEAQSTQREESPSPAIPTIEKRKIAPALLLNKTAYCPGEPLEIALQNGNNLQLILNGQPLKNNRFIAIQTPGEHKLCLARINADGKTEILEEKTITVHSTPQVSFDFVNMDTETKFNAHNDELSEFYWYVGGELIASNSETTHRFSSRGKYRVKLVAVTQHGCKDSSEQLVRIMKAYNLLAPQVYNPNNGSWIPLGLLNTDESFDLKVISEKGEVVFNTNHANNQWNGVIPSSGKIAENGSEFFWVAKVTNSRGKTSEYGGSFIISSQVK
jgi:hypothetical protein